MAISADRAHDGEIFRDGFRPRQAEEIGDGPKVAGNSSLKRQLHRLVAELAAEAVAA